MAFGFPAKAEETRRYGLHYDQLNNAAINAVGALGWKYRAYAPYQFALRTRMSALSWGEQVSVTIYSDGTVHARSVCSYPLQVFDWGKNKRNIDNFFATLDYYLSQGTSPAAPQ